MFGKIGRGKGLHAVEGVDIELGNALAGYDVVGLVIIQMLVGTEGQYQRNAGNKDSDIRSFKD